MNSPLHSRYSRTAYFHLLIVCSLLAISACATDAAAPMVSNVRSSQRPGTRLADNEADATRSGLLTYQWKTNGVNVAGATNVSFTLANVTLAQIGTDVRVRVTNAVSGVLTGSDSLGVVPANPHLLSLSFVEGDTKNTNFTLTPGEQGTILTTNVGILQGRGIFVQRQSTANEAGTWPVFSANVPSGTFTPSPTYNRYALHMGDVLYRDDGTFPGSQGGRAVDFTNSVASPINTLGKLSGLTICGWLNPGNLTFRPTVGNQVACALDANRLNGFGLANKNDNSLQLAVNEGPSSSLANRSSAGRIPAGDTNHPPINWVFFAVTYDGAAASQNLSFYFGDPNNLATIDVTLDYPRGVINLTGQMTVGNYNPDNNGQGRVINGENAAFFRGLIDEFHVFSTVLTLAEIQACQVAPVLLSVVIGRVQSSGNNVTGATVKFDGIGKSAITDNQGRFAITNVTASSGYLLTVSAAGFVIKRFPNISVFAGTNDLGDLQIGNPVNLPVQLRPLVPDVNPPVSNVEEGGTAYRYYQVVATDGRTLVGGVIVGLRRAGGAVVPQDGDTSTEWAGYETGKPDADGLVRLRLPSADIGNAGSTATFEVMLGATVVQTFTATVKPREYEQVWKHKWSVELGKKTPVVKVKGQSHETKIIRKFGGSDDGLEIVGRERDEEFKVGVGLDFGARLGRTGAGSSVGVDGSLKVGLGQSFRFSPDTTDVLDNLLKLNAAFADNLNLVPLGGIVLEGMREQLEGYILGDQVESRDTSLKLSGHAKGEAGFGAAVPWSDDLAVYADGELAANIGVEVGASYHPGGYFDSYVEFSGNLKLDYDAKNTFGTPAFFQGGGSVKGTVRRDADGDRPRQLILESKLSVTTDSAQPIGWNDNDILQLQPLETAEYRDQYTLRLPGLSDTLPVAQSAWESINQRGQGSVFKVSQPVAWLSSVLGAGDTVAYEKSIYAAQTTLATSPILGSVPVIHIELAGEKHKGAVVKTQAGLIWKNRRIALENYVETPRAYYPSKDIFELERKWLDYAAAPIGGFLNRAVHAVSQAGETIIGAGESAAKAVVRFGQGVMSGAAQVTTTWVHYVTGGGQLASTFARKGFAFSPEESFLPPAGASNFVYGIGGVYRFDSTNAFNGSGTLTISFTDAESSGLNKADLQIYHLPDSTNRWRLVGGVVNALSNTVTVAITNLGTFAIAPPLPSGDLILSVASNTLPADGVATSIITVSNLMLNNGQVATQLWLYTVSASGVEIMDSDVTTNYSGVQLVSTNGMLRFTVRAPLGGNSANISVASVAGDAAGELAINLVDNAPPLAPSGVTVIAGKSRLFVSWQTNAETDLAGYRVYYRAGGAGPPWDGTAAVEGSPSPIAVAGTNLTLRGLAMDTNYFVAVVAVDTTGNESLPTVVGPLTPINTPPQPPTGLAVSFGADGTNFLSWALSEDDGYNDRDVVRYDIYRAVFPGGAFEKIGEAPAGVGLFSETNSQVVSGNYLRYAVIAIDTNGQSSAQVLANHFLASGNGVDNDREGMADDWESSHGLNPEDPADGNQDLDGDNMSNLAEYRAGTNPNDSQSFLWIQSIGVGGANGVQITWGSVSDKLYSIQRASLLVPGGVTFTNLAEHIRSSPPQNVFLDTTATNSSQFFYRVKVE